MPITDKIKHVLLCLGLLLLCTQPATAQESIDGIWRAEHEVQPGVKLVLGITIRENRITFDSPNQGMFDQRLSYQRIDGNQVAFKNAAANFSFNGTLKDNTIVGSFTQGATKPLTFYRLDDVGIARLHYEGAYRGRLEVTADSTLPLVLNVAATAFGFLATLDSPAQQSYGIPTSDFTITDDTLRFNSPFINASFDGKVKESAYVGTFTQGKRYSLTLNKPQADNQAINYNPKLGKHGGAVAIISPDNISVRFYGDHDASTLYEIGSVTKTMVGYALAQMVQAEQVSLSTPIADYIAAAPAALTFDTLSTHTSGLPRLPANLLADANPQNPYQHYSLEQIEAALAAVELTPTTYEYSNFGYGVLAQALAKANGTTVADLFKQYIFTPLAMTHSFLALSDVEPNANLADGYNAASQKVSHWTFDSLAGAGAVVASTHDISLYIQGLMKKAGKGDPMVAAMLKPRHRISTCCEQTMGWVLSFDTKQRAYAWHNGQTGGFSSFVGFYLDGSHGVVVLNNQSIPVNDEALALLLKK